MKQKIGELCTDAKSGMSGMIVEYFVDNRSLLSLVKIDLGNSCYYSFPVDNIEKKRNVTITLDEDVARYWFKFIGPMSTREWNKILVDADLDEYIVDERKLDVLFGIFTPINDALEELDD